VFTQSRIPLPTKILMQVSWWSTATAFLVAAVIAVAWRCGPTSGRRRAACLGPLPPRIPCSRDALRKADGAVRAVDGDAGGQQRAAGAVARDRAGDPDQQSMASLLDGVALGVAARRPGRPLRWSGRIPPLASTCSAWAKRPGG
jgi:hypothetical protein